MLDITCANFTDSRTGAKMFQLTMKKDGSIASISTDYVNLMNKKQASEELGRMINYLCENVYKSFKD